MNILTFCRHATGLSAAMCMATSVLKGALEVVLMPNDIGEVEAVVYKELRKLREAERFLCAAFEDLQAERIPAGSIIRILYQLAVADERMDRLELLLDIMENCPLSTGTVAA